MKYEIRKRKDGKEAIFDEKGNRVSEWFDYIEREGLVEGDSNYYLVMKDGKWAIFDVNGKMITPEWFNDIYPDGLVKGESEYYIVSKGG
ncbi:MAG: hypothetical protein ACP5GJ_04580, partial [Nanopusillaceae archaeon]